MTTDPNDDVDPGAMFPDDREDGGVIFMADGSLFPLTRDELGVLGSLCGRLVAYNIGCGNLRIGDLAEIDAELQAKLVQAMDGLISGLAEDLTVEGIVNAPPADDDGTI